MLKRAYFSHAQRDRQLDSAVYCRPGAPDFSIGLIASLRNSCLPRKSNYQDQPGRRRLERMEYLYTCRSWDPVLDINICSYKIRCFSPEI